MGFGGRKAKGRKGGGGKGKSGKGGSRGKGKGHAGGGKSGTSRPFRSAAAPPRPGKGWAAAGGPPSFRGARTTASGTTLLRAPTGDMIFSVLNTSSDDKHKPFLYPKPRRLVSVPGFFTDVRQYCATLAHNLLAEFWCVFKEGGTSLSGTITASGCVSLATAAEESFLQNMLIVNRQPCIVTGQSIDGGGGGPVSLTLKPAPTTRGFVKMQNLGYIGNYLVEFACILELAKNGSSNNNLIKTILQPNSRFPGEYAKYPLRVAEVPINLSQKQAVDGLSCALEKIQGPPGTGKSTTIFHIIASRIPKGRRVLVTCSRNVAVESITQKIASVERGKLLVFGNAARIGPTAREHLLEHAAAKSRSIKGFQRLRGCVVRGEVGLGTAIREKEREVVGGLAASMETTPAGTVVRPLGTTSRAKTGTRSSPSARLLWQRALLAFLRKKYAWQYALSAWCERVATVCALSEVGGVIAMFRS